jgi:diguanylate cyclase (GGDEF)-like protein
MVVADKIRNVIAETPVEVQGTTVQVTASVGGAAARQGTPSYEVLINEADAALYSAKRQGRNRTVALN